MTPQEIVQELRREWWMHHGCPTSALYGDDGEMSCGNCGHDFNRQPLDDLQKAVTILRLKRAEREIAKMKEGSN